MDSQTRRLHRFIDSEGRLVMWPRKADDKLLVCQYLADKFEAGRTYTEMDVNAVLKQWHTFQDWPLLRRELCERGLLSRDKAGLAYSLAKP